MYYGVIVPYNMNRQQTKPVFLNNLSIERLISPMKNAIILCHICISWNFCSNNCFYNDVSVVLHSVQLHANQLMEYYSIIVCFKLKLVKTSPDSPNFVNLKTNLNIYKNIIRWSIVEVKKFYSKNTL